MDELTFPRLRAFLTVAQEQSFSGAAARLHVAQQALSASVARLERELAVRLFQRTTRTVVLTEAGAALRDHTQRALDELARGVAAARRVERQARGLLSVGVMAGAALELTEPILAAFALLRPEVTVSLEPHLYDDPSAGLRSGSSDVALLRPPLDLRGLELARLFVEPRVLVVAAGHPLARRRQVSLAELREVPVVQPASPDPIWNHFWSAGSPRVVVARTLEAALELVSARRAVAISTAGWTRFFPRPGVRAIPVSGLEPSQVAVGWRRGERRALVREFLESAQAVARQHPALVRAIEVPRSIAERRRTRRTHTTRRGVK